MYAHTASYSRTRRLTMLAALSTIAYALMVVGRIPVVAFLKYDPKDVIIAFAGFIYGPVSAFMVSLVVSIVEMVTVSDTGVIGLVMNILSTCAFACTAAVFYKRKQTQGGAVAGLVAGGLLATAVMMLWNYLLVPLYMTQPREDIVAMLVPVFLPFNLIKAGINATLTLLLYKPLVRALRAANLIPPREEAAPEAGRKNIGVLLVAGLVLATCILVILVFQGVL